MMAINTHRQLGVSQTDGAKSMEKLSSGLRINRAGDDAAGLAISEKMRGQIRGLNMASRNSQDTISLIQTAEGALAETHSILQRMRELAVQAANDTNTDADRFEIQSEIKQLKAEVDRIANSTEFNTRKLLEGSAKGIAEEVVGTFRVNNNSGVIVNSDDFKAMQASISEDRSWKFDGAYMVVKVNQTLDNGTAVYNANDFRLVGSDGTMYDFVELGENTKMEANMLKDGTIIADGGEEVLYSGEDLNGDPDATLGARPDYLDDDGTITLGAGTNHTVVSEVAASSSLAVGSSVTIISGEKVTLGTSTGAASITYTSNGELQILGTAGAGTPVLKTIDVGRSVTLDDGTVIKNEGGGKFSVISGSLTLGTASISTIGAVGTAPNVSAFTIASQSVLGSASVLRNPDGAVLVKASNYQISSDGAFNNNVTIGNSKGLNQDDITNLRAGSVLARGSDISIQDDSFITLIVNGKELEIKWDGDILRVGDRELAAGKSITLADGTVLTHSTKLTSSSAATGKITVTSGSITLGKDISCDPTVDNVKAYTIAKDSTIASGSKVIEDTKLMAGTVVTKSDFFFPGSVTLAHGGTGIQFSANGGNSLSANYFETKVGESITFVFSGYTPAANSINDSVMAQVGANSGQTSWVSMGDMRAKALGIDKVDISTKWAAAVAIETVNNALQKVSHQRASLGAMQNRLEHTIKNLDTAAENLQASESRIRDVDMAKEIMEYTKNSILQQASQAMLAQANQTPQSVLQLLRG
jgi:flagellin